MWWDMDSVSRRDFNDEALAEKYVKALTRGIPVTKYAIEHNEDGTFTATVWYRRWTRAPRRGV